MLIHAVKHNTDGVSWSILGYMCDVCRCARYSIFPNVVPSQVEALETGIEALKIKWKLLKELKRISGVKLSRSAPERRSGIPLRAVIEGRMGRGGNGVSVPALLFPQFNLWFHYPKNLPSNNLNSRADLFISSVIRTCSNLLASLCLEIERTQMEKKVSWTSNWNEDSQESSLLFWPWFVNLIVHSYCV
jgi:hypothetical protein